uniref:Uncharacterized protein n=1 Tax=Strongyloides stercoralis TaxID=6248 RepID=A0AAF5I2P1_STRER
MTFGGVVPEIKRFDYEVSYVDQSRIYGLDNNGKLYNKKKIKIKKRSGDDKLTNKEYVKKLDTAIPQLSAIVPVPNKTSNLHSIDTSKNDGISVKTELDSFDILNINSEEEVAFTIHKLPSLLDIHFKRLELENIQKLSTSIKPSERSTIKYSKEITEIAPQLIKLWKNYIADFQKQINKYNLPKDFPMPNFLKNNYNESDGKNINYYQEKDKLKSLNLTTTLIGSLIEESTKIGLIHSLKKEYHIHRQCFIIENKLQKKEKCNS